MNENEKKAAPATPSEPKTAALAVANGNMVNAFGSASNFDTAQRMAKMLAASALVPDTFKGNVASCTIALEMAARIGASPLMVMQSLDIVYGRPSWRANFLIATVNANGRFSSLRYRWEGEPGKDSWGCRAVARERETGEELIGPLVTIAIAKADGWYGRKGSKWQTLPELMLCYRAATLWTRLYAPELSMGIRTSDEEMDIGHGVRATIQDAEVLEGDLLSEEAPERPDPPATPPAPPAPPEPSLEDQLRASTEQPRMREPGED